MTFMSGKTLIRIMDDNANSNVETQEYPPKVSQRLNRVGVTNLRTLVKTVFDSHEYKFVPRFEITIDLPAEKKGVHMSRLVESIAETVEEEAMEDQPSFEVLEKKILERLKEKHPYERGEVSLWTELVVESETPATKRPTMEAHDVSVKTISEAGRLTKTVRVKVIGNTVCPHSLENTGKPHIQRAVGELEVETGLENETPLQEMIRAVEESFSCPVYTLVKTDDENAMVRRMYDNPRFVEDVARAILDNAKRRFKECSGCKIRAKVTAQESIHRHDVVAEGEVEN